MTYQLSRFRLASVGDRAARFTDLTLDVSSSKVGSLGQPVDSILWLRNGGGKSSLLSLFFALLLPMRRDFMGKTVKRYLEDYVASGDTSHTVAEWVATSDDSLLPSVAPRLITGAVYEWVDRRKPVDPDRDRDKLKPWYYTFFAAPDVLDLDQLPVHDDAGWLRPMSEFVRLLREMAATKPQQFSFAITNQRGQWMETLTARNLDPALFGYQKQMNHSEGGVAELFNFTSTDKFIDFLIDLTVDSTQPDLVASNLRKVVDILARKPDLLVDRDFCGEIAGRLDTLAERHGRAKDAEREAAEAGQAAAHLAGAFRSAAATHEADKEWFAGEEQRLREQSLKLDRDRNRVNDIANEFLRIAATYRHTAAIAAHEDAETAVTAATNEDSAWQAVEPLSALREAESQAESVRQQMAEEERQTAPLRAKRDDVAATVKARYAELAMTELGAEEEASSDATTAAADAEAEDRQARECSRLATTAETHAENLRGKVIEIDEEIGAAIERGDLPDAQADVRAILAKSWTAKRETTRQRETVRGRRRDRPALRKEFTAQRQKLAADRATKVTEHDQLAKEYRALVERVDELATHARLAELVQLDEGGRVDLWAEEGPVRAALTHAIATIEASIVDTKVDAADDDRALEGLRAEGFLPTTRDAQRAAEAIADAARVAVRPGWELLRDVVAESERATVLANATVAELAAGVVVADADADAARRAARSHVASSIAHVTVCTASQLQRTLAAAGPEWLAVSSDPALFDPAAADAARADRELRRHEQDRHISELHEQVRTDRALLNTMDTLLRDCPAGHLDAAQKTIDEYEQAISNIDTSDGEICEQIEELDQQDEEDSTTEQELSDELAKIEGRIQRLQTLAERVADRPEIERAIAAFDKEAAINTGLAEEATSRAKQHRESERELRRMAGTHKSNRERYERHNREISLLDTERAAIVLENDDPLSVLRGRFDDLDTQWRTVASQSVLAERLNGCLDRGKRARHALAEYQDLIRDRAKELLATADGQDPERRVAASKRARSHADTAQQKRTQAETEVTQAKEEVARRTPRDRQRHAQLDVEPATEAEARELAAAHATKATEMSSDVTALQRDAEDAGKAASVADKAALGFGQRAHRLADAAAPTLVPDAVPAYRGDGDQAEADVDAMLGGLNETKKMAASAREKSDEAMQAVRRLASENRFSAVPDAIRDRFTGDAPDILAERAADRAQEMRVRRKTADDQLADIGRDQRLVVIEIAALVQHVLANLESAHRHSKLPGTLGGWANEHFLRIRFVRPASEDDLNSRIDAVVDRIVAERSKPEGLSLLKLCVHEAVAPRGFTVKVLKPNSDLAVEPVDVTHLGKFSGGEKLTVCVALYCTLARLRAINRGQGRAALGGTLVLDNPLGTASHVALLKLQRDVAAAHGVQLVYTTGVEDLGAVGQFPNVLRMRNAPGALRTRRYVIVEDQFGASVDGVTSVRVARDDAAREAES
ncbi:MAG TPA: hypothetical protein VHC18_00695 [Amycolatopsis sp.]|nr:hypothetical protein [Amycolatopsis sp.]